MSKGESLEEVKDDVLRLQKAIVRGNMQDLVIKECGIDSLLIILKGARLIKNIKTEEKNVSKTINENISTNKNQTDQHPVSQKINRSIQSLKSQNKTQIISIRTKIRDSLYLQQIQEIVVDLKRKRNISTFTLSTKSNVSQYSIEAIENGSNINIYDAARLVHYLVTNRDIDNSKYKDNPKELFVDYLSGKRFSYSSTRKRKSPRFDNPKACNLRLFLKK